MLPNPSHATIISMYHQASLDIVSTFQESAKCSSTSRVLKIMIYKPTRQQILIPLNSFTTDIIVANATSTVEFCSKDLVKANSKLRVESVLEQLGEYHSNTVSILTLGKF